MMNISLRIVQEQNTPHGSSLATTAISGAAIGVGSAYAIEVVFLEQSEGPTNDSTVVNTEVWH